MEKPSIESEVCESVRQGDVLLVRVPARLLSTLKLEKRIQPESGRLILARGEATGHHHSVPARHARMYETAMGTILQVVKACQLEHQEHGVIDLMTATYLSIRQQEYTPRGLRNVQD